MHSGQDLRVTLKPFWNRNTPGTVTLGVVIVNCWKKYSKLSAAWDEARLDLPEAKISPTPFYRATIGTITSLAAWTWPTDLLARAPTSQRSARTTKP